VAKVKNINQRKLEVLLAPEVKVSLMSLAKASGTSMGAIVKNLIWRYLRDEQTADGVQAGNVVRMPVKKAKEIVQPVEVTSPVCDFSFMTGEF
jgi:hypothetical protein